jgi:hypothetical protein
LGDQKTLDLLDRVDIQETFGGTQIKGFSDLLDIHAL